ncbi:2-amino-4-hydroxy-6-hydroxymethyldihydropteridine diphosphokinase [Catenovulum sp. SM1970]|uniref:2-amino-4-hydroxy-6- hydroxymethyldihydropteridine diphosphokinase n=1 Tax=Marinifaba aquimaris TaxID=2741323 RepID=UPI001571DFD7|nr:2-amino-4-hydroxy-6-hydroxymethyldihydropteridine diphosphokinase [Marinifaba aquimaris]NTS75593.1 2-amino-4-hydroxy-6-hydroxymethyldihydropteridine diphosphokinase [Marinifaba aquimaris]
MTQCFIGLGSNLSTPVAQLNAALKALEQLPNLSELQCSSFYGSKPMGPQDQPDYVNAVASFNWQGDAITLLDALQKIELEQGRVRKYERWGPRTLDLDIILFGDEQISTDRLTVPHYGLAQREFVLYPLAELNTNCQLPDGTCINDLLKKVPLNGLTKLNCDQVS